MSLWTPQKSHVPLCPLHKVVVRLEGTWESALHVTGGSVLRPKGNGDHMPNAHVPSWQRRSRPWGRVGVGRKQALSVEAEAGQ